MKVVPLRLQASREEEIEDWPGISAASPPWRLPLWWWVA